MAAVSEADHKHRWFFSNCSHTDITELLPLLSTNCLLETNPASALLTSTWETYSGRMLDPNAICQRTLNNTQSYMGFSKNLYGNMTARGDQVCQHIWCKDPETSFYTSAYAPDGLICDVSKRCSQGICQPDTSPQSSAVDPNSIFGDQARIEMIGPDFEGTCSEYVALNNKSSCYNDYVGKEVCTKTCGELCTGPPGCKCGDKSPDCVKYTQDSMCPTYGSDLCCGFCQGYVGKRSTRDEPPRITIVKNKFLQVPVRKKALRPKLTTKAD